jgi:hypothetical protein
VYLVDSSNIIVAKSGSKYFSFGSVEINASELAILGLKIDNIASSTIPNGTYRVYINSNTSTPSSSPTANGYITISSSTSSTVTVPLYASSSSSSQWLSTSTSSYHVYLVNSSNTIVAKSRDSVSFTNSGGTIDAATGLDKISGLTINNIPSNLFGIYQVYISTTTNATGSWSSGSNNLTAKSSGPVAIESSPTTVPLYDSSGSSQWTNSVSSGYVYLVTGSDQTIVAKGGPASFTSGSGTIGNFTRVVTASSGISNITYPTVSGSAWTQVDNRYKSPLISDDATTKCRINFTATSNASIVIQLDVSSEIGYDFAFISTLDNASATSSSGYYADSRISGTTSATVTIPVSSSGAHTIDIGYHKNGSIASGSDCAWFKVIIQ